MKENEKKTSDQDTQLDFEKVGDKVVGGASFTDVKSMINLPEGTDMVMPGGSVEMVEVKLVTPIAKEQGLRIAIREGGRTVGSGRVATIIK